MWKGGWWEEGVLGVKVEGRLVGGGCVRCGRGKYEEVEGRLVGGGYVRCGRGKYKEVEGRLVEEGMLDEEEVNMKKLKGG